MDFVVAIFLGPTMPFFAIMSVVGFFIVFLKSSGHHREWFILLEIIIIMLIYNYAIIMLVSVENAVHCVQVYVEKDKNVFCMVCNIHVHMYLFSFVIPFSAT